VGGSNHDPVGWEGRLSDRACCKTYQLSARCSSFAFALLSSLFFFLVALLIPVQV
jgi:hypothetical protein